MIRYLPPQRVVGLERAAPLPQAWPELHKLRPYQKDGSIFLRTHLRALLADEMGLGKSLQALSALPYKARAIVCCPASVALVWEDETYKWRPDLTPTTGEELRRPRESEVLIVPYSRLPDPPSPKRLLMEATHDVHLILDEGHMLMSPDAQRTRKARLLRSQCASTWMLTGTPMPGNPDNLWGVLSTLGVAGECFEGWEEFVELCGGKKKYVRVKGELRNVGYTWKGISPVVRERMIAGPMLRRTTKEVLPDLPSLQRVDVPVEAPESLTEFLDKVKSEWDEVGPNDLPPFELISEAMAALARSKMRAAVEFVNNAASLDFPLLVFSAHVDPVIAIGALKGAGFFVGPTPTEERNALIKKFQAGKLRILAMSIGTGGVGLNLQRAAGVVFVDRSYTPTDNWQAEKRAHRPGQERDRVMCWRLISRHALDQRLSEILDEKETNIQVAVG